MAFKQELFSHFARVGKAFGNGRRLELIELLAQGERSVEDLAEASGLSVANASQHLQVLRQAGLVATRRAGQRIYYRLTDAASVTGLLDGIQKLAAGQVADVRQLITDHLHGKDALEPVATEELARRMADGEVVLIDVRPPEEFAAGHVAGAINVPLGELDAFAEALSAEQEVVAYCRGPYCVLAYDAVVRLRASGLRARRLASGYPEWVAQGLPVAQ